ncbi:amino acid ABC transporter permease [Bordetella sp. N]|uniref:amino acid ABC transporter permease n=1 Tax=Bordetella sp. N TaxID=1746199 RepID=UPI00070C061B|nr:amino acid ABC transporter permease [Bordetella sp. N]ALM86907.1 amino acid ABC transporter permease [Bordetella sp. N]
MINILHDYGLIFLIGQYPNGPLGGLALTLCLAVGGLMLAFPLSVLVGIARTSTIPVVALPALALTTTVRALPVLLIIFWAYFMVPLITGHTVSGVTTVVCALVLYETAFLAEVIRAGIQAIPKGQVEASRSLGMSYAKTMRKIVLPQALRQMTPSILNQFINLIKNTSLGYIISVNELTYSAYQVSGQLLTKPFQVYFILASFYFIVCYLLNLAVGYLERRSTPGLRASRA